MSHILEVRGLQVAFAGERGNTIGTDRIDFFVDQGETVCLVGESGCGKTTLGKSIIQLVKATDGTMMYDFGPQHGGKKDLRHLNREDEQVLHRRIQIVFQDPYSSLNPSFTIYQSLADPLRHFGVVNKTNQRALIADILEAVNMRPEYMDRYPHEFSGGQRQRVGIAQALLGDPAFLIFDEPTVGLDPEERIHFRNLFSQTAQDRLVLLSTHIVSDVETIAGQIIMFKDHRLYCCDSPARICAQFQDKVFHLPAGTPLAQGQFLLSEGQGEAGPVVRVLCDAPPSGGIPVAPGLEDAFLAIYREEQP